MTREEALLEEVLRACRSEEQAELLRAFFRRATHDGEARPHSEVVALTEQTVRELGLARANLLEREDLGELAQVVQDYRRFLQAPLFDPASRSALEALTRRVDLVLAAHGPELPEELGTTPALVPGSRLEAARRLRFELNALRQLFAEI